MASAMVSEQVKFYELSEIIRTITPPKKIQVNEYLTEGDFPVIDQSAPTIAGWTDDENALVLPAREGVIVFGDHTCVLKFVSFPFAQGADGIKIIEVNSGVNPHYVYAHLRAFPLLNDGYKRHFSELKRLKIRIPKLSVQNAISEILETIDSKIATNLATSKTLETIAQAIFKSWFLDFDPVKARMAAEGNVGMDDLIAGLFPNSMEATEIGLIPKGWNRDSLGQHISVTKGKSYKSSELQGSNTALVTLKSFARGGGYRFDGLKAFSGAYKAEQVVEPGELVVSFTDVTQTADVIGKPAIVLSNPQFLRLVASLDVGIVRPKSPQVGTYFLYQLFQTSIFNSHIRGYTNGTTVLHLGKGALEDFIFPLPPIKILKAFEEFSKSIFEQIQSLYLQNLSLQDLRDWLLPRLVSGELEIPQEMRAKQ